ncbi:class I SAM-dependent methyltransferase [Salegentibacter sp. F14]
MNQLQKYFEHNKANCIDKWLHYFDIYDFWFNKYKNKSIVILEIGVFQGGSLKMWRDYFGEKAKIYAIDIQPSCKQFESENTKIFIGSQEDREFLSEVKSQIPEVDIIIDDGGHTMNQQIVSFEELYGHLKDGGIYLCEDLHTSYWEVYGGGYGKPDTFIEYSKGFIDSINAWYARDKKLKVNNFTLNTYGLHYYPSMLVIQKRTMEKPVSKRQGSIIIPLENFSLPDLKQSFYIRNAKKIKKFLKKIQRKSNGSFKQQ